MKVHFVQMKVGLPSKKNQQVRVGEAVEVFVLSDIKSLSRFMAVRDVYLPDVDLWLAEDPCLERPVFENLIEILRASSSSTSAETPALKVKFSNRFLRIWVLSIHSIEHNWGYVTQEWLVVLERTWRRKFSIPYFFFLHALCFQVTLGEGPHPNFHVLFETPHKSRTSPSGGFVIRLEQLLGLCKPSCLGCTNFFSK